MSDRDETDTDPRGVDRSYVDAGGVRRDIAPDTVRWIGELIGEAPPDAAFPLVITGPVVRLGGGGVVDLEDGSRLDVDPASLTELPFGYHRLVGRDGRERPLIVCPPRCHVPNSKQWGIAAQVYATRSRGSWGIGDLADLREVATWASGRGASFVLCSPLGAVAPCGPQQPSPYSPATRRFRNPIYLRVDEVPGAEALAPAELDAAVRAGRSLDLDRLIDRDAVWAVKLRVLEAIWRSHIARGAFEPWRRAQPASLRRYATWAALVEQHGRSWREWPDDLRRADGPGLRREAARLSDRIAFHEWLQWLLEVQLGAVTERTALVQDLPIGVDPGGFDAWDWQDLFADGVTVGAPPDQFNRRGQDWGLPPFVPWRLRAAGYDPFVQTVRASMASGGGLRIDHVMGLFRLWWVPDGGDPSSGAFVRYPADDLLSIVALESHRAGAFVVGEDLGTVEPGVRERLSERGLLSYKVLWFEEDDPAEWPSESLATVTTHDLPTVVGLWSGSDLEEQARCGLDVNVDDTLAIRERLRERGSLAPDAGDDDAAVAAHRLLAAASSTLVAVTLDDLVGEPARPNLPGADRAENWSLALPVVVDDLGDHATAGAIVDLLAAGTDLVSKETP